MKRSLILTSTIKEQLKLFNSSYFEEIIAGLHDCNELKEKLNSLNEEAPIAIAKGKVMNDGVNADLDELRQIAYSGKDYLLKIQRREIERTGISSLKISYNNVFGYYLEVTHAHKDKVPQDWIRKQTLTTAERYITPELKEYEEKILGAEEKIIALETKLFEELVQYVTEFTSHIQQNYLHIHLPQVIVFLLPDGDHL